MANAQEQNKMEEDQNSTHDKIGSDKASEKSQLRELIQDGQFQKQSSSSQNQKNTDDDTLYEWPYANSGSGESSQKPGTWVSARPLAAHNIERADDQGSSDTEAEVLSIAQQVHILNQKYNWLENASDADWNFKNIASFRDCPLLDHLIELKELATYCLNKRIIEKEMVIKIDAIQLRFLLKTIQFAKISGRNLALEEMEKLFAAVGYPHGYHHDLRLNVSKTFDGLVMWFRENDVLGIMLRDNLHLMAFVERIEKILMVLIRQKSFRTQDLDQIWTAFWGKHDVVQRNMLMMLSEIARSFNSDLIGRFFELMKMAKRLDALHFFINECSERQCFPDSRDIQQLWKAIVEHPVTDFERQRGFRFFGSNLLKFLPETNLELFHECLLNFPPKYFSVSAFNEVCVMLKRSHIESIQNQQYDVDEGIVEGYMKKARDYLWNVILEGSDQVFFRAIEFAACEMENMNDSERRNIFAEIFINECFERLENFGKNIEQACTEEYAECAAQQAQRVIKVRFARSKRDTASYNFVSSMTRGDTPESSGEESEDGDCGILDEEMLPIILANNQKRIFFLMDLADLAHRRKKNGLRDDITSLLDHLTVTEYFKNELEIAIASDRVLDTVQIQKAAIGTCDVDVKKDENNYFSDFIMKFFEMAWKEEHRRELLEGAEKYVVPRNILYALFFTSWTATRGSVSVVTCRKPPPVIPEVIDCDLMDSSSVTSDTESSIASSFIEDLMNMKLNDRSDSLCEMLAIEALDAFVDGSQFCPDVYELFHTPECLLSGNAIITEESSTKPNFYEFVIDGMLHSNSERVRKKMSKCFFVMLQQFPEIEGETGPKASCMIDAMFAVLPIVENNFRRSTEYFECLFQLLNYCQIEKIGLHKAEEKFAQVTTWLENTKNLAHDTGLTYEKEELLPCYLKTTMHILRLMPRVFVSKLGSSGSNFLNELFDEFLMPFSKAYKVFCAEQEEDVLSDLSSSLISECNGYLDKPNRTLPLCRTDGSIAACLQLIIEIIRDNPDNMNEALLFLNNSFYNDFVPKLNAEPIFPFLQRDPTVFVGLKNAGATCYMNSVLQQLFMIEPFRQMILEIKINNIEEKEFNLNEKEKKINYGKKLLFSTQKIFAHLLASDEQFYIPQDFWETFQFTSGQDMNTREQQDAVEFFNSLADALDEVFKASGGVALFEKFFGGTLSDQKKCRDCPHVFIKEQLFTSIAVDVRSHNNLRASLNEYVTGDLLEGDNAYFCEICKEKVTCVKRMCVNKLPPYLVFQLKRFDMDWNRNSPIKFFDYFDFPMTLDMEPYTTSGVERNENPNSPNSINCEIEQNSTIYRLRGVVVHSGEANGGHYYSFIADTKDDGKQQWYRFDDIEVTAWDYNDNDARFNWYGGYNDGIINEKDKRRFSAYMLVYEAIPVRNSTPQQVSTSTNRSLNAHSPSPPCIPSPNMSSVDMRFGSMSLHSRRGITNRLPYYWEKEVTKNNLKFAHEKFQFTNGYFKFIQDLTRLAGLQSRGAIRDEIRLAERALHIFSCFLYTTAIKCPNDFRKYVEDLKQTFEFLVKHRPEVCVWFMSSFFMKTNVIQISLTSPFLNGCELRNLFEIMVYRPIMICLSMVDGDNGSRRIDPSVDRIVDEVIAKMLQLCKSMPSDSSSNNHIFNVLILISQHSLNGARRLISQNALYSMITIFGVKDDFKYRLRLRDLDLVFELLGLLLISCTSMNKPKNDEIVINPYSRNLSKSYYVPENCQAWFSNSTNLQRFFTLLLDNRPRNEILVTLCCYLCFNNITATGKLVSALNYRISDNQQLRGTLDIVKEIIKIEDMFQNQRIKMVLLGNEKFKIRGMLTECGYLASLNHINKVFSIVFDFLTIWQSEPKIKELLIGELLLIQALKNIKNCMDKAVDSRNSRMILGPDKNYHNAINEVNSKLTNIIKSIEDFKEEEIEENEDEEKNTNLEENPPNYESVVASDRYKIEGSSAISGQTNSYLCLNDDESDPLTSPITFNCSRRDSNSSTCANGAPDDDIEGDSDDMNGVNDDVEHNSQNNPMIFYNNDNSDINKLSSSPLKAGKKRHLNPTSAHGSSSSLPSYEMPTSRKIRHEQSPHTSPVKMIPIPPPLPSYEECVKNPVCPMETDEDSPPGSGYTGRYSSDGPPSA